MSAEVENIDLKQQRSCNDMLSRRKSTPVIYRRLVSVVYSAKHIGKESVLRVALNAPAEQHVIRETYSINRQKK